MKQILLFIAGVIVCVSLANNVQAQSFRIGVKAGANFSSFDWSDPTDNNDAIVGYQAGIMARIKLPIIGLTVHPELLYTSVGSDFGKLNYLQVPINLNYSFNLIRGIHPFILVGPYWAYALNKSSDNSNFNFDNLERTDWGLGLGLGIEFLGHLQLTGKYDFGFTDLSKDNTTLKNRVFSLSLGYLF